jgi:hypothetical protein
MAQSSALPLRQSVRAAADRWRWSLVPRAVSSECDLHTVRSSVGRSLFVDGGALDDLAWVQR